MVALSILVAEDNRVMADILRFNLTRAGYDTVLASDGQLALERARERQFDLVITDYQMPRVGGDELCRELRKLRGYGETPIFLCSAKGLELNHDELRSEFNIDRVLSKPFSPSAVVEAVNERLRRTAEPAPA